MNTKIMALALLLAGTASGALAQEQAPDGRRERPAGDRPMHPRGEMHDRAAPGGRGEGWRQPQPAPAAPQARPAPAAPEAQAPRGERPEGGRGWQGGPAGGQPPGERAFQGRPDRWTDRGREAGARPGPADRADREGRQDQRDRQRFNGGQGGGQLGGQWQGDRRGPDRPQARDDRRDRDRYDGRGGERRDGDWNRDGGRRDGGWNRGDGRDRPQWRPGAYPRSFHSVRRYRVAPYIRPPRFYVHSWSYGEVLPYAWFGPEYVLEDWWNYDLPAPPPGLLWVRVGDDALLVDGYTGRVLQAVRDMFW